MIKRSKVNPLIINGPDGKPIVTIRKYVVSGDIVELLRSLDDRDKHWDRIADAAADEIEHLRGLLRDRGWAEGTAEWMEWERKVQEALGE